MTETENYIWRVSSCWCSHQANTIIVIVYRGFPLRQYCWKIPPLQAYSNCYNSSIAHEVLGWVHTNKSASIHVEWRTHSWGDLKQFSRWAQLSQLIREYLQTSKTTFLPRVRVNRTWAPSNMPLMISVEKIALLTCVKQDNKKNMTNIHISYHWVTERFYILQCT